MNLPPNCLYKEIIKIYDLCHSVYLSLAACVTQM